MEVAQGAEVLETEPLTPKRRRHRLRIVIAVFLLAALVSGAVWFLFVREPAPKPLQEVSERILVADPAGILAFSGTMAISPSGRHWLYLKSLNADEPYALGATMQPYLMDIDTGESLAVPLQTMKRSRADIARGWMDNIFSARGTFIHAGDSNGVLDVYHIHRKALRKLDVGEYYGAISDDEERTLFLTKPDSQGSSTYHIETTGFAGERLVDSGIPGMAHSPCNRNRLAVVRDSAGKDAGLDLCIVNVLNGSTMKTLRMDSKQPVYPSAFWTRDGRYFCFNDMRVVYLSRVQRWTNRLLRRGWQPLSSDMRWCVIWDSRTDRIERLDDRIAIAPGPNDSSILLVTPVGTVPAWSDLRAREVSSGKEWALPSHSNDYLMCAYGRWAVVGASGPEYPSFKLVEMALPGEKER